MAEVTWIVQLGAGTRDRAQRNGLMLTQGRFRLDIEKIFFMERVVKLEQAAWGTDGIVMPGRV